jgi:hypothetical protein
MNNIEQQRLSLTPTAIGPNKPATPTKSLGGQKVSGIAAPILSCPRGSALSAISILKSLKTRSLNTPPCARSTLDQTISPDTVTAVTAYTGSIFNMEDFLNDSLPLGSDASAQESAKFDSFGLQWEKTLDNIVKGKPVDTRSNVTKLAEAKYTYAERVLYSLTQTHLRGYYNEGCTEVKTSFNNHFRGKTIHGKKEAVELVNIEAGISDTRLVKVGGKNKSIVKRVALPAELLDRSAVKEAIAGIVLEGLKSYGNMQRELDAFITTKITDHFDKQIAPYYTGANREKLAELVGAELGVYVPEVEILKGKGDKVYSTHKFVKHASALHNLEIPKNELNVQSVQDIFILDAMIKNQDRHAGNLLFTQDGKAIPIDHALSLQGIKKDYNSTLNTAYLNSSLKLLPGHANKPLTKESIEKIKKFNVDRLLGKATVSKRLKVETDVKNGLRERSTRAKQAVLIPGITAHQFIQSVCSDRCLKALQTNSSLDSSTLLTVTGMSTPKWRAFIQNERKKKSAAMKIQHMARGTTSRSFSKRTMRNASAAAT